MFWGVREKSCVCSINKKIGDNNVYSAIAIERDLDNIKNAFELLIWTVIFKWMPLASWEEYGKATIATIF